MVQKQHARRPVELQPNGGNQAKLHHQPFRHLSEYPGAITNGGQFSLSGTLASGLEGKPIVLLVNNDDSPGEFSMFTFRNVDTGELAKYPGVVGNDMTFFFGSQADAIIEGYEWYAIPLFNDNFNLVPEPATATLSLLGLAALMMRRRR